MAGPEAGGSWQIQSLRGLWQVIGRKSWREEPELMAKPALLRPEVMASGTDACRVLP